MTPTDENLDDVISSLIDAEEDEQEEQQPDRPAIGKSVELTPRAAKQIHLIRRQESIDDELYLRVAVEGGGCAGLNYKLGFDFRNNDDTINESEGISIIIDPRHLMYLEGIRIDYPDGLDARGFTFDNPNATDNCGCGASFAI